MSDIYEGGPLTPRPELPGPGTFPQFSPKEIMPAIVTGLPSLYQRVLYLVITEELSIRSVAKVMGLSARTVSRLHHKYTGVLDTIVTALTELGDFEDD